jgi:hypothetical protein
LGRHVGGGVETFLVPEDVAINNPHKFEIVGEVEGQEIGTLPEQAAPTPPPPPTEFRSPDGGLAWTADPTPEGTPIDLTGLSLYVQRQLTDAGLITEEAVKAVGEKGLVALKGIGPATAKKIMELTV